MPIDVSYPIPLLEDIMADAQPVAILTEHAMTQYLPAGQSLSSSVFSLDLIVTCLSLDQPK